MVSDRYYNYEELTNLLRQFEREFPDLVKIESIGKSYEGRDIWLAIVTQNPSNQEKPAVWVQGNIHAAEVSASSACLHLIHTLTQNYGHDDRITMLLNTRIFYVCPRVGPDGVEWFLADKPRLRRSSTRPYPYDEDPLEGLVLEDIDGDGRILQMRIPDPNGHWKIHPDEPRLMVRREPDEYGGTYYRLYSEGRIENYDGITVNHQQPKETLDLNRNYPNNWRQDHQQRGAGPFPTSEPEVRAVTGFISTHNNICIAVDFHTMAGVLFRPFTSKPDFEMSAEDIRVYQKQGAKGYELTGYPDKSLFHAFTHPTHAISGGSDWIYEHMGMFMWIVEIWNPRKHAGIEVEQFMDWWREHPLEHDLKLLKWSDEKLNGEGYIDWHPFLHPQLGQVEIGGVNAIYAWYNPPPHYLEQELEPLTRWLCWLGLTTPRLELFDLQVTPLGGDNYRIRLAVHNTGWLPTYCTQIALQKKRVRGVMAEIELPEGAALKAGKVRTELTQLAGRSNTASSILGDTSGTENTADRTYMEWIVEAPKGIVVTVIARHDRAGIVRREVLLD